MKNTCRVCNPQRYCAGCNARVKDVAPTTYNRTARMAKTTKPQPRSERVTSVAITVPMTFKGISEMTGVPAGIISNRYHAIKAETPRKRIGLMDLVQGYKPKPRRKK